MAEKLTILEKSRIDPEKIINTNNEIYGSCRHKTKFHRYYSTQRTDDGTSPEKVGESETSHEHNQDNSDLSSNQVPYRRSYNEIPRRTQERNNGLLNDPEFLNSNDRMFERFEDSNFSSPRPPNENWATEGSEFSNPHPPNENREPEGSEYSDFYGTTKNFLEENPICKSCEIFEFEV